MPIYLIKDRQSRRGRKYEDLRRREAKNAKKTAISNLSKRLEILDHSYKYLKYIPFINKKVKHDLDITAEALKEIKNIGV